MLGLTREIEPVFFGEDSMVWECAKTQLRRLAKREDWNSQSPPQ